MQITNHTTLLNALIEKHSLKSYLEIGVQSTAQNFDKIKCDYKIGIEPEPIESVKIFTGTSNEFFATNKQQFDIVFIDGLHHADQVKRDFENSLRCLPDNGYILLHDTLPDEEPYTVVPRETKKWFGDVYKFAMTLNQYPGIGFVTFNIDCGCTLVWKMPGKKPAPNLGKPMDWNTYKEIGNVLLNVTDEIKI